MGVIMMIASPAQLGGLNGTSTRRSCACFGPLPAACLSARKRPRGQRAPIAPVAAATALLPEAAATAAGGGATAAVLLERLLQMVDPHVAGATVGASAKLAAVCALVGWLLKTGQLPSNTAAVMSKVSFTLLIPAMLFTKVATTLAAQPDPSVLATISVVTLAQIGAGALAACVIAPLVDRMLPLRPGEMDGSGGEAGAGETGLRRLVTLAASFGSSFTLPVVFFSQMLPAVDAERALGFTALILLSWSPLMWSFGLGIVNSSSGGSKGDAGKEVGSGAAAGAAGAASRLRNATVAAAAAVPAGAPATAAGTAGSQLAVACRAAAVFGRQVLTPPFLAILAGMLAGLTPAGRAIIGAGSAAAVVAAPSSAVVRASSAVLRSALDVIKMLAGGTLAAQTVVLAASLLQQPEGKPAGAGAAPASPAQQSPRRGGPLALLLPSSSMEARALATVAITRFLLLPSLMLGAVWGAGRAGLLPSAVAADPVLLLVLLVEAVMPSAQNLIVLCTLSESTATLAPMLASLLLKLYALSILPVSLWVSAWATWLGVAVA